MQDFFVHFLTKTREMYEKKNKEDRENALNQENISVKILTD